MPDTVDPKFYLKLSVEERLALVGEILASVADAKSPIPLTDAAYTESKQRLAEIKSDPARSMTWTQLCEKLGWQP